MRVFANPVVAFLLGAASFGVGCIGGAYGDAIKEQWPFGSQALTPSTLGFYCLGLLLLPLGAALVSYAGERQLLHSLATLPPKEFSQRVFEAYGTHCGLRSTSGKSEADLRARIQSLLKALTLLAHVFDGRPNYRYAANVMTFAEAGNADAEARLRFVPSGVALQNLMGALDLQCELSATVTKEVVSAPDKTLKPMALPLPPPDCDGALPGAPRAFLGQQVDYYANVESIVGWASGRLDQHVVSDLDRHFQENPSVQSFFSVPLLVGTAPMGVLNIHRAAPTLFNGDQERVNIFRLAVFPIVELLAINVEAWIRESVVTSGADE